MKREKMPRTACCMMNASEYVTRKPPKKSASVIRLCGE